MRRRRLWFSFLNLLARVRCPLRAVRLFLELRADKERRVQVFGIDDFSGVGEPILAGRILERHEVLDQPRLRTVGHAVTPQPAGREAGRHHGQISSGLGFARAVLSKSASAPPGATLKRGLVKAIRLLPCSDRIALHRRRLAGPAELTVPEGLLHVAERFTSGEMQQTRLLTPVGLDLQYVR